MDNVTLQKARILENSININKIVTKRIDDILLNFNEYRANLQFESESGNLGSSNFNSKNYGFKESLKFILEEMKLKLLKELKQLEKEFHEL